MATLYLESGWASLPMDILDLILDKLFPFSDYVRLSAVCKRWLSIAADHNERMRQRLNNMHQIQLPLLMIPTKDNSGSVFSIFENKICDFELPVPFSRRCCGSSHGWLAFVVKPKAITLMNPISGRTIRLPPIIQSWDWSDQEEEIEVYDIGEDFDYYEYQVRRVILSPQSSFAKDYDDYVVAAIYGAFSSLAVIKSGDEAWTYVKNNRNVLTDIIYYRGQVHAVDAWGGVETIEFSTSNSTSNYQPRAKIVAPRTSIEAAKAYLVESSAGDLLMVQRFLAEKGHKTQLMTSGFKVLKLQYYEIGQHDAKWIEMKSLGDDAIFLGDNYSICVSVASVPGCKSNCIYYTDDCFNVNPYEPFGPGDRDMCIYSLDDGSFGLHYKPDPSQKHMPPPFWIVPTLPKFKFNLT